MERLAMHGGTPVRSKPWPAYPCWDEKEEEAILAVLRSREWGRLEEGWGGKFEKEFAEFQQAGYCLAVSSGSAALQVGLKGVGVEYGDEVILPPYTFIATATACLSVNAKPVWVDIRPDTLTLDPDKIEAAITRRTRAVIPVHVAGTACHMEEIKAVAGKHGIAVIEDACQAHGAIYKGHKVGALGDGGAFSFQWSKNITAGEGGALVTDDEKVYDIAWSHHNAGRLRSDRYLRTIPMNWNVRMPAFQAGVLIPQIRRCPELFARRAGNVAYLREKLGDFPGIKIQSVPGEGSESAYHLLLCRLISEQFKGLTKAQFLKAISAEGIPFGWGYQPLYQSSLFDRDASGKSSAERHTGLEIDPGDADCPVCENLCAKEAFWAGQSVLLGNHQDMEDIVTAIHKIYENSEAAKTDV